MKEIQLTQGKVAFVDDEDYERVSRYKWSAFPSKKTFYAARQEKRKTVYLHRFIVGVHDRIVFVDHKDRNGLNCQKDNLRKCSNSQNMQNGSIRSDNAAGYKGVHKKNHCRAPYHNWRASIIINGKNVSLGYFDTALEAAKAYDEAAKKHFGEFASTNF